MIQLIFDFYLFQAKFNTFVLNLRNEYSNKVTTFRQVITIHREDSLRTNTHWEDTVKVMNSKSWNRMIHWQHVYPNGIKHATDIQQQWISQCLSFIKLAPSLSGMDLKRQKMVSAAG